MIIISLTIRDIVRIFIDVSDSCPLSAQTDFSIGSENTYTSVEQKPIYPANAEITDIKTQILNKEVEIALFKKEIEIENSKLCAFEITRFKCT